MCFRLTLSLFLLLNSLFLAAQSWDWVQQFGDTENESADEVVVSSDGGIYMAGSYEEGFVLGSQSLPWAGLNDAYVARLNASGEVEWVRRAGGIESERTGGLALAPDNSICWAGSYWQQADFGSDTLQATYGAKAIFIANYSPQGQLNWLNNINGNGLKEISHLSTSSDGSFYLTGFFGDSLFIGDTILVAAGEADLLLARFDEQGQLLWAANYGETGFIRGISIQPDGNDAFYVSGYFKGQLAMAGDTIHTNTADNDLFVARLNGGGEAVWLRKAGGVHEDFCTATAIDSEGQLYLTGYFYGVLKLSDAVEVQASGFNDNLFLLKYAENGEALWAVSFGGQGLVHAMDIQLKNEQLLVGGYFRGELALENIMLDAGNTFDSFISRFSLDGNVKWVQQIETSEIVLINRLALLEEERYLAVGGFRGTASFDITLLNSVGDYDIFLARGADPTTAVKISPQTKQAYLFPNPVSHRLHLRNIPPNTPLQVIDPLGRILWQGTASPSIDLSNLPIGSYFLHIFYPDNPQLISFIKS